MLAPAPTAQRRNCGSARSPHWKTCPAPVANVKCLCAFLFTFGRGLTTPAYAPSSTFKIRDCGIARKSRRGGRFRRESALSRQMRPDFIQ